MTDTVIGAIVGVGGTIIGAIIAGPIAYWFSKRLIQANHKNAIDLVQGQEFNKAAACFRTAFIKEQRLLSLDSLADRAGHTASDIFKAAIDRHESAMLRFKPFVCKSQVEEYKKAWKDYAGESRHAEQYSTTDSIKIPIKKTLALSKIEKLLKFAEPKH